MPKLPKKRNTTSKTTWKQFENKIARIFGSTRTPLSGGNSKITRSDSLSKEVFIECKYRAKFPTFDLWKSTQELAKLENKIPIVAIKKKGERGFLYVVSPDDIENIVDLIRKHRENGQECNPIEDQCNNAG